MSQTIEMTFPVEGLQDQKATFSIQPDGAVLVTFPGLFMSLHAPGSALQFTTRRTKGASAESMTVAYAQDEKLTSGWVITLSKAAGQALQDRLWNHLATLNEAAE